jgi:cytidyltransferase-like protein
MSPTRWNAFSAVANSNNVALIGGVFDPLHAGHLAYIKAARPYGTLVCALSDAPSKHPPLVPLKERAQLLEALGCCVIPHDGTDIPRIIQALKPSAYIKGADWAGKLPEAELAACHRTGTSVVFTDTKDQSSSKLLAEYERARTAEKLADFELFVQTQADQEPWKPVTPYDRESRRAIEAPHADRIVQTFDGRTVLDYGCGFGYLVELLNERGMTATGWDLQFKDEAEILEARYDLVICREVLEHVPLREWPNTIWWLIHSARKYVYLTTRFTAKSHLLDVDGTDDLDPTHISMVQQDFLRSVFALHGCTRRPDLEAALDWRKLGRCLVYEVPRD